MTPKIDLLPGHKFGRLTVISEANKKGKERCFLCKCECGNDKVIRMANLRSGATKSCGCLQKENVSKNNTKDITGERFGKLTAIKIAGKSYGTSYAWLCKCDCGGEKVVSANMLQQGHIKSCGCYKLPGIRKNMTEKEVMNTLVEIYVNYGKAKTSLLTRVLPFTMRALYDLFPGKGLKEIWSIVEWEHNEGMDKHMTHAEQSIKKIKAVLDSDLTAYRIAKEVGYASANPIHDLRKGKADINSMKISTAIEFEKLHEKEIKKDT